MRCRATGEAPGLGQVGEDRNKGKFQLILYWDFCEKSKTNQSKEFRFG